MRAEAARQSGEVAGEWRLRAAQAEEAHRAGEQALQADMAAQLDALQQLSAHERSDAQRCAPTRCPSGHAGLL